MCYLCKIKPVYEFTNKRKVCGNCFVKWFDKKIFYTIRRFEMLSNGDLVNYEKGNGFREVVLENVLKMVAEKGRIKLTKGKKFDKVAIPITTDLMAYNSFNEFINGNIENLKKNKKIITPLILFLDKEVLLYAKLKKLKFEKDKKRESKTKIFVNYLEKKHPEIKRSIVNGFLANDLLLF